MTAPVEPFACGRIASVRGTQFLKADAEGMLDASAFTDAVHVRWSSSATLTTAIFQALGIGQTQ